MSSYTFDANRLKELYDIIENYKLAFATFYTAGRGDFPVEHTVSKLLKSGDSKLAEAWDKIENASRKIKYEACENLENIRKQIDIYAKETIKNEAETEERITNISSSLDDSISELEKLGL